MLGFQREQILGALRELLRGFERADRLSGGALLREMRVLHRPAMYTGLVTVLLRMVFVLYAEERGLLPMESDLYASSYSLSRLHASLSEDHHRYGDTINDRFGAWGRVITLFRLLHDGVASADGIFLPPRRGTFFDPDAFPFLEGRPFGSCRQTGEVHDLPRISDGVVYRMLDRLLLLDGERLQYKGLDVEQIGSVYECLMGFELLEAHGSLILQPGEERRRTGSHYTPRSLTQPIVETTLRPVLERLGADVTPDAILALKVCDPAMGAGAFLVEACRQLADRLVDAWRRTGSMPVLPRDEEPVLHARRLIAQRCIYGLDKNPLAVDLARLSIWLVTSAKKHPFTFVDHALRHGDSLVGLSREQIACMSLDVSKGQELSTVRKLVAEKVQEAEDLRAEIHALGDPPVNDALRDLWDRTGEALGAVRMLGDLVISSFFSADSDKARKTAIKNVAAKAQTWLVTGQFDAELRGMVADLREGKKGVPAFHWEVEFPEVFSRDNPGFDIFVGNPPFAGKNTVLASSRAFFIDWLKVLHEESHGNADLVAHFFRRAFKQLRKFGTMGLIATNTIAQGDTRTTGLHWICKHGGFIYDASRRYKWPGLASVVVSIVHVLRDAAIPARLDGKPVPHISAFLFHGGGDDDPIPLTDNAGKSFVGSYVLGMGFTFDDTNPEATSIAAMHQLIKKDPRNTERIFPYLGGEEVNSSPTHAHRRYVINFGDMREEEARSWPDLWALVRAKVKPCRMKNNREGYRRYWWHFGEKRVELYNAIRGMDRVLAIARVTASAAFSFLPSTHVFSEQLVVFSLASNAAFTILQSRPHETWARFFASTLEDRLRYTRSDCFETFPFPPDWETNNDLEAIGKEYYEFRAVLMVANNEGLTKTYNRFHDPDETSAEIKKLRGLHTQMDRVVLEAYGWKDLVPVCDFHPQLDESIRYTWSEETRDEVLARLLECNRALAAKEAAKTRERRRRRRRER